MIEALHLSPTAIGGERQSRRTPGISGAELTPEDLPLKLQSEEIRAKAARSPLSALYDDIPTLDELERRYLLYVLEALSGNRTRAAEVMGIDRRTLYRMAERFGIKGDSE